MRTGKRNWLILLGVVVIGVLLFSALSNRQGTAVAATDTRSEMERYVDAYSKYTEAQLERFKSYQAAVVQSDWDSFWMTMFRVSLGTAVLLGGYSGFRFAQAKLEGISNKARLVSTPYGIYWVDSDVTGKKIPRPIDNPLGDTVKNNPVDTLPIHHNGDVIEASKDGRVIDVVKDAEDFLDKAIRANGYGPKSKELPRHESMGVSAEKWSAMVHETLGGLFTVENRGDGMRTYCTAYPDLATTYYAVKTKEVPLPEKKKAKK